jgi:hypothetical protein
MAGSEECRHFHSAAAPAATMSATAAHTVHRRKRAATACEGVAFGSFDPAATMF